MKQNSKLIENTSNLTKGIVIGSAMLIPGMSGGTMSIICGIYDKLLSAVASVRENPKQNLLFLGIVACGGLIGILLFSRLILYLYHTYQMPMMFFFMGAVLGSIPILYRSAQIKSFSYHIILFPAIGVACLLLFSLIPEGTFTINFSSFSDYLYLFMVGIFLALALVLPGISFSYMMLIMGIYEQSLIAVQELQILYLAVLGLGIIVGIFLTSKAFKICLDKFPQATYLMIIGFVVVSLKDVFPGLPQGSGCPICIAAVVIGFCLIFFLSKKYAR